MENFDAVYAAHFQAVYRFLLGLCRSAPLAEELCQDAFVQAMIHWRDFRQLGELFHKSDTWARVTFYRAKVKLQEAIRRDEHEQV